MLAGMKSISRPSPAKINLTLKVGPARADGFHEIESLVARVGICDTVTVTSSEDRKFTLSCSDHSIPCDETNLALRAALRLAEKVGLNAVGAHIELIKRIPAGAGLGGGSSNAATTLMLLNELWETGFSQGELADLGAGLGSDVPLFLHGPLCVMRGRGELVEEVHHDLEGWVVLVLPGIHVATPEVYAAWDRLHTELKRPAVVEVLERIKSSAPIMPLLFNDLQPAATAVNRELAKVEEVLDRITPGRFLMTGSGSAFFSISKRREAAEMLAERIRRETGLPVRVTDLGG